MTTQFTTLRFAATLLFLVGEELLGIMSLVKMPVEDLGDVMSQSITALHVEDGQKRCLTEERSSRKFVINGKRF